MDDLIVMCKKVHEDAKIPFYATNGSAGCDFYSIQTTLINPGETIKIRTGISIEIPQGYFLKLEGRSGLSSKGILTAAGVIDSDYRGEIQIILHNTTKEPFKIEKGDRIVQGIFMHINKAHFHQVNELSETKRGTGGFESTGKR